MLDVAVDLRRGSPTFGHHLAVQLSGDNKHQLFIPRGFGHGFVVLSESAIFSYKVDNYYSPDHDRGVAFDDPALGIDWQLPADSLILSNKDRKQPTLSQADNLFDINTSFY